MALGPNSMKDDSTSGMTVQRIIIIEGLANLLVLIAKLIVGFSTGSLAILSDAIHSLTDLANNFVAWTVIRLSNAPADREHPYGHHKFETLAVFGLASLLVVLAFELALQAIKREHVEVASSAWELGVMLGVLTINIVISAWQRMWARRLHSDIILADASHTFSDVLITLTVIIGWQLSAMGFIWLDQLCALAVSGLILFLAFGLFKRAVPVLVDQIAVDPEQLKKAVNGVAGVMQVTQIRSRWIGSKRAVDMIIEVDPSLSTEASHNISQEIESLLEKRFQISDISIHIEPFQH